MVEKMQIMIAGGAGFIGSHLSRHLAEQGHEIIVLDNFCTSPSGNIELLEKHPNIKIIKQDIIEPIPNRWEKIDAILNLACPASPVDFGPKSIEILSVCSQGVLNLLELARKHNARFLQASTSECYGDPLVNPQPETYWGNVNPIGVRSCYDEGKRFAEAMVMAYHRKYNLQTRIARIFNTYGPDMRLDDGRVLPNFISQALLNKPLTIYGQGSQTRSFCYVDDLVEGLLSLLNSNYSQPVNLGNPDEIPVLQLANEVIELTASKSKIEFLPLPNDDPKVRQPDITLAKKLLNWHPKTDRMNGIKATIVYFRKVLGLANE
ncbi:MAG: UDP-glucuronic acid decarboxylase family protein [Phycisphaerae bacterium]